MQEDARKLFSRSNSNHLSRSHQFENSVSKKNAFLTIKLDFRDSKLINTSVFNLFFRQIGELLSATEDLNFITGISSLETL